MLGKWVEVSLQSLLTLLLINPSFLWYLVGFVTYAPCQYMLELSAAKAPPCQRSRPWVISGNRDLPPHLTLRGHARAAFVAHVD